LFCDNFDHQYKFSAKLIEINYKRQTEFKVLFKKKESTNVLDHKKLIPKYKEKFTQLQLLKIAK